MSIDNPFTKDSLDMYLSELGKEYRRLIGKTMPAELILVGGAAVLINYGFRASTYDVDAIVYATSAMKDAINRVRDKHDLPHVWFNTDFVNTDSYTTSLIEVSRYYRTFSNVLKVRTINAEYLVAMKLMAGRQYKHDLSDIVGIMWEHHRNGNPITYEDINHAVEKLYGGWSVIPQESQVFIKKVLALDGEYEEFFTDAVNNEQLAKEVLLIFDKEHPGELKKENINDIIESAKSRMEPMFNERVIDNRMSIDDIEKRCNEKSEAKNTKAKVAT